MCNSQTSILVLGAGELGTAILDALAAHPSHKPGRLSVLRRAETLASPDPVKKAELVRLSSRGITFERGDFINSPVDDLIETFKQYDVVIQAGGYGARPGTLIRVTEAALAAGVKRFFPWQFGVDYEAIAQHGEGVEGSGHRELFGEMLAVRKMLREQKQTQWTVVSTGLFMSFLFLPNFGVVDLKNAVVRALGGWENRVTVTDVQGIGRMVAEVVYEPRQTENAVVYIGGDTVSYADIASILEGVYGRVFQRELWVRGLLKKRLEEEPGDVMRKYQDVFGAGIGVAWDMERTVNHQRGIKLLDLRGYILEKKDIL